MKPFIMIVCLFPISILWGQNLSKLTYAELDSLVMIPYAKRDYLSCLPYMQAGMEKAKAEFGNMDSTYAAYVAHVAYFYEQTGAYSKSEMYNKEALSIRKKILGEEHSEYATSLNNLAALYRKMANFEESEVLTKKALALNKKLYGEQHPSYAICLNNLASLYSDMERVYEAEPLLKQSVEIRKAVLGPEHPDYASALNNLAMLYQKINRYKESEVLFKESMAITKKVVGENHPSYAGSLNNLGLLYRDMKQYDDAIPMLKESMDILKKTLGESHPHYAWSLNNLALAYSQVNRNKEAEALYLESIRLKKEQLGEQHPDYIGTLNNPVMMYFRMQRYKEAWDLLHQSIKANTGLDISMQISPEWADSVFQAKYISERHLDASLQFAYRMLEIDSSDANKQAQIILCDLAMRHLKRIRDQNAESNDKLRKLIQTNIWTLRSLKVLDKEKEADKAFLFAEQSKSVLLMDAVKTEKAYHFGDLPDSLAFQEKRMYETNESIKAKLLENRPPAEKDNLLSTLNESNMQIEAFKKEIEKSYPKYAALRYEQTGINVKEIQHLLDEKTAFLEYVIDDEVVYIFYIDKKQLRLVERAITKSELARRIKGLHEALSNYATLKKDEDLACKNYWENAHWFYENLVAPVLPNQQGTIEHLIIVPDGELGYLPFETFLKKPANQSKCDYQNLDYLLNDYRISYNYSATLWKENTTRTPAKNNGQILGMAANYEKNLELGDLDFRMAAYKDTRASLQPLPAARKEVEVLEEQFGGFFGFDNLASERVFKEKAGDYGIIHLAMHGLLHKRSPILSSLAFTEDGDSVENNFLQAYEISKLKLNADLVILSACETGYGRFEMGNGIASLARAFMYAGAPSLIVSLWQVSDYSTSKIMQNLYQNLAAKMDKAEALRQAKLAYLKEAKGILAHPAFWSAFIQLGDSRPITIAGKTNWLWWSLGGVALLLIGGIFFKKRSAEK